MWALPHKGAHKLLDAKTINDLPEYGQQLRPKNFGSKISK